MAEDMYYECLYDVILSEIWLFLTVAPSLYLIPEIYNTQWFIKQYEYIIWFLLPALPSIQNQTFSSCFFTQRYNVLTFLL